MSEMFSAGTAVFFTVLKEDGSLSEKEGEIRAAFDDEGTAGRTYEIHVRSEGRISCAPSSLSGTGWTRAGMSTSTWTPRRRRSFSAP